MYHYTHPHPPPCQSMPPIPLPMNSHRVRCSVYRSQQIALSSRNYAGRKPTRHSPSKSGQPAMPTLTARNHSTCLYLARGTLFGGPHQADDRRPGRHPSPARIRGYGPAEGEGVTPCHHWTCSANQEGGGSPDAMLPPPTQIGPFPFRADGFGYWVNFLRDSPNMVVDLEGLAGALELDIGPGCW